MARDVTLPGVWAEDAQTEIPPVPVSGDTYRNTDLSEADAGQLVKFGQKVDSANWNEYMFRLSSLVRELEQQGILAYSPQTLYKAGGIAFHEGVLYQTPGPVSGVAPPNAPWVKFMPEGIASAVQSATIGGAAVPKSGTELQLPAYPAAPKFTAVAATGPTANTALSFGGTFTVPQVSQATTGQLTATARTMTMPAAPTMPTVATLFPNANGTPTHVAVFNSGYATAGYATIAQLKALVSPSFSLSGTTLTITP